MIDDILKLKKLKLPGPGQYKVKEFKIPNVPKQNTDKGEFINNSKWYGMQTPGHKYKVNYDAIRAKTPVARYYKPKKEESFSIKPKKTKDPAPGSYNVEESFVKTQWPKNQYLFNKEKMNNFLDMVAKKKAFVPGIGKYKEVDRAYKILSRPCTSLRRLRS